MSFKDISPYFEQAMAVVDPDFREWPDAFNIENIPSGILDKSWHLSFGQFNYAGTAHTCSQFQCPVTLEIFVKGYRNPKEAIDSALIMADAILVEVMAPEKRLATPGLKNILPGSIRTRALSEDNDNSCVLEMEFSVTVFVQT